MYKNSCSLLEICVKFWVMRRRYCLWLTVGNISLLSDPGLPEANRILLSLSANRDNVFSAQCLPSVSSYTSPGRHHDCALFYENAAQEHGSVIDSMAALNKLAVQTRSWGKIPEEHTQCSSVLKHCRAPFARQTHDGLIIAILICSLIPVLEGPLLNYAGLLLGESLSLKETKLYFFKKYFLDPISHHSVRRPSR